MAYFPMFVDLTDKKCIVAGGGNVAARKIAVLVGFGVKVQVVAPEICEELADMIRIDPRAERRVEHSGEEMGSRGLIVWIKRCFEEYDLKDADLVIAATDDRDLNHRIAVMAKSRGQQVDSATDKNDCSFLFPAVVRRGESVVGISSSGSSPAVTAELKRRIEQIIPEDLTEKAEYLEKVREKVKENVELPGRRRSVMRTIAASIFEEKDCPSVEKMIDRLLAENVRVDDEG